MKISILDLIEKKKKKEKITALTAYDYLLATFLDQAEIDLILIGDSLGNVFCGYENTIPVTIEQMLYHTKAVSRAAKHSLVVADMPFLSYQISLEEAKRNAGILIKEGGAQAVKLETGFADLPTVEAIINIGIPVMGHIGFTPQSVHQLGGYKVQGKNAASAKKLLTLAKALEKAGCFSIVFEMLPEKLAKEITESLTIPTIGIGAGKYCDGQILVTPDMLGVYEKTAKFVKKYAHLNQEIKKALQKYKKEVQNGDYPSEEFTYF